MPSAPVDPASASTARPSRLRPLGRGLLVACLLAAALAGSSRAQDEESPSPTPPEAPARAPTPDPSPSPVEAPEPTPPAAPQPDPLTVAAISSRIAGLESNQELEEGERAKALELCREIQADLERTTSSAAKAVEFKRLSATAAEELEKLRERPAPAAVTIEIPPGASLEDLSTLTDRAQEELKQVRAEVERLRREISFRTERSAELNTTLVRIDRELSQLRSSVEPAGDGPLAEVRVLHRRARERALEAQRASAAAEQQAYTDRRELLPALLDAAKQEEKRREKAHELWRAEVAKERQEEAEREAREARRLAREAAQQTQEVSQIAAKTTRLTELRKGELGENLRETSSELANARHLLSQLRRSFRTMRRKVDAAGLTQAMGLLLRQKLKELPDVDDLERRSAQRAQLISEVQYELIVREEERASLPPVEEELQDILATVPKARPDLDLEELTDIAREVLVRRQRALDAVVKDNSTLFNELVELDAVQEQVRGATLEYRAYVEERILWVRSVKGEVAPNPRSAWEGLTWLVASPRWPDATHQLLQAIPKNWHYSAGALLLVIVLIALRVWAGRRLRELGETEHPVTARTAPALYALGYSALCALPLPALVYMAAFALGAPEGQPPMAVALSWAGQVAAVMLLPFECARIALGSQGFAVRHLGWDEDAVRRFRQHLLWLAPVALFSTVLVVAMDVQLQDSSWNDSLGRLGFALGTCALAMFCMLTLLPSGRIVGPYLERNQSGVLYRARYLWYASAVGLPLFFVALALRGFYYTATSLLGRLSASFSLVLLLMVAHAVLRLWLESAHARRVEAHEAAMREREKKLRRSTVDGLPPPEDEDDYFEEEELEDEVGRLFRAGVAVALLFGLWGIWADVLPALRRLERVQVYPTFEVLSAEDEVQTYPALEGSVLEDPVQARAKKASESEEAAAEPKGGDASADPGAALQPGAPASDATATAAALPKRVTLADVGLGLLLVLFTVIATRSLPALLELILLQRLPLDAGARYAFTSVARYVIIFLGSSVALGTIGIGWSNLQWLAAALTFGLGFGLQEIFANFVSGLIILFERPVRVGDVITIGGVTGTVTRLRMRATTIRHLDNRELIVPNRELVTGEVINWSLSDPTIRIELPVGVAYGSDTLRVRRLLVQIARRDHQVLRRPRPRALFLGFGGSSLDFELRVYIAHPLQRYDVLDRLHHAVDRAFREDGIEISFPQQDLHIRTLGPLAALAEQATGLTSARRVEAERVETERAAAEEEAAAERTAAEEAAAARAAAEGAEGEDSESEGALPGDVFGAPDSSSSASS